MITFVPRSDAGGAEARRRRLCFTFIMLSLTPNQRFLFVFCSAAAQSSPLDLLSAQSSPLDLRSKLLEKTLDVSARVLETTRTESFNGDPRKIVSRITSPTIDPLKGWLSLCFRSDKRVRQNLSIKLVEHLDAGAASFADVTSLRHIPYSEFSLHLRSRSRKSSLGCSRSELLLDKAKSSVATSLSSHRKLSSSLRKRDSVFSSLGDFRTLILLTTIVSPPSHVTDSHPCDKMLPLSSSATSFSCHSSSSTSLRKRDSVSCICGYSKLILPSTIVSPPSFPTGCHPGDEMLTMSSAVFFTPTIKRRDDEKDADVSPISSSLWARPIVDLIWVSPLPISYIINFNEMNKLTKCLVGLNLFKSSSMILCGFTEALIGTFVHTMFHPSVLKRSLPVCPMGTSIPLSSSFSSEERVVSSSKVFSMRRTVSPALLQIKLSISLTVLLSCGAVRTGSEDATGLVLTISRGVDWLSTSHFKVTKFQLSSFAVNLASTHSSFTLNSLSSYPRVFSTPIYDVLLYCTACRARIISSSRCSPNV